MSMPKALNPIALELGPFTIYWYGLIILTGALIGLWFANKEAEKNKMPEDTIINLMLWAFPIAILSVRLYYVIFQWDNSSQSLGDNNNIWYGRISIHGALCGWTVAVIIYAKKKNLSFWILADIVASSLLLEQAIGRWGNIMNQEPHGGPVSIMFLEKLKVPDFIITQMYI